MKKAMFLASFLIAASLLVVAGCAKDPITGTWQGTIILKDIYQKQDTSALKLELTSSSGLVSGKVTATKFGWQAVSFTNTGTYSPDTKYFTMSAVVGGDDGQLTLVGNLGGGTLSGDATTTGLRTGTFSVEK